MQGRMLYLPNAAGGSLPLTPATFGMTYEDVRIEASDGIALHGWFIAGQSKRVLLFFHGNAGDISHRLESLRQFQKLGLSIFIIDYRGYGQSAGKPNEAGLYRDALAAWTYLTEDRGLAADDIVVLGRSLGGSVAAWLAAQHRPLGLVVESAFTSVPDVAQEIYAWLPVRWLSHLQHATREYIRNVYASVLVVHSLDDEIIGYHHGEAIFAATNEPRSFLTIRGSHNDAFLRDEATYIAGLKAFLAKLDSGSIR